MKILVVGAGIYGCHIALKMSEKGFKVDLIEKESDIMQVTTNISLRAHTGYFYARSPETLLSCKKNSEIFRKEYPGALFDHDKHYYIIAKKGSKITGKEYLETLDKYGLPYKKTKTPLIKKEFVDVAVEVEELSYDPNILREEVRKKLKKSKVNLLLNTNLNDISFTEYDLKIICGYAHNNDIAKTLTGKPVQEYEYRFCEKVIVKLPKEFYKKNFVIMDGPFFQIDPYGKSEEYFALSHFQYSIHSRHEGNFFEIDKKKLNLLNKGIVKNPKITNGKEIIREIAKYIPGVKKAKIVGSVYAIKVVSPNESSDNRQIIMKNIEKDVVSILSGKVSGCVEAADSCIKYARKLDSVINFFQRLY